MLTKTKVQQQIEKLTEEEFSIDELIEKLIVLEKIELGNQQSETNESFPKKNLIIKLENGSSKLDKTGY